MSSSNLLQVQGSGFSIETVFLGRGTKWIRVPLHAELHVARLIVHPDLRSKETPFWPPCTAGQRRKAVLSEWKSNRRHKGMSHRPGDNLQSPIQDRFRRPDGCERLSELGPPGQAVHHRIPIAPSLSDVESPQSNDRVRQRCNR